MTIQQLQYILEVHRTGSITKTAKNFFVSQSSVSNAISALENELGFPIFNRSRQGVLPTKQGLEVLTDARLICEHHQRILKKKERTNQPVCILSSLPAGFYGAFARTTQEWAEKSDAGFVCESVRGGGVNMDRLVQFEADVFVTLPLMGMVRRFWDQASTRGLEVTERAALPMVARIGPGHRLYHKADLSLDDLKSERMVDNERGLLARSKVVLRNIPHDPERSILVGEDSARRELVASGVGFGVGVQLPREMDQRYGFRNIPLPGAVYHVLSVTNPQRDLRPEAKAYLEHLDELLADIRIG